MHPEYAREAHALHDGRTLEPDEVILWLVPFGRDLAEHTAGATLLHLVHLDAGLGGEGSSRGADKVE